MANIINQNRNRFKPALFLVVDRGCVPMTWDGRQFCYASRSRRKRWPAEAYKEEQAKYLIEASTVWRRCNGYSDIDYFLLPLNIA